MNANIDPCGVLRIVFVQQATFLILKIIHNASNKFR
jgi:hypothetical protein